MPIICRVLHGVEVITPSLKSKLRLQSLLRTRPRHIHIRINLLLCRSAYTHAGIWKHVRYVFPHDEIREIGGTDNVVGHFICALGDIACFAHVLEPGDEFVEGFDGLGVKGVEVLAQRYAGEEDGEGLHDYREEH
jgi:hypothetical protein